MRWCARRIIVGGKLMWHDSKWAPSLLLSRPGVRVQYPSVSEVRIVAEGTHVVALQGALMNKMRKYAYFPMYTSVRGLENTGPKE